VASDTRVMVPMEGAEGTPRSVCSSNAMDRVMEAVQEMARVDGGRGRRERLWASLLTGQALAAAKVICRLKALRKRSFPWPAKLVWSRTLPVNRQSAEWRDRLRAN
jgi:RNA polymerase-interacting CarD/CdnL/TRCF family regulator